MIFGPRKIWAFSLFGIVLSQQQPPWCLEQMKNWLSGFGHDVWRFPSWIQAQMDDCSCKIVEPSRNLPSAEAIKCFVRADGGVFEKAVPSFAANDYVPLSFCACKQWLLQRMPPFDLHYLPPSVSVTGGSMLDDTIAFAMMADNQTSWSSNLPTALRMSYILPYAAYHESRDNWRPLLFAKFFPLVAQAKSTVEAMKALVSPAWSSTSAPAFTNWTRHTWDDYPVPAVHNLKGDYLQWASSTNPPVIAPSTFAAYGYGSCTAWASLLTYVSRAVGIPARQAGTPCWNSSTFVGLATENANVSQCWNGGNSSYTGGSFLNNHNWVEYYDDVNKRWSFQNVPPQEYVPNSGLCGRHSFSYDHGCDYDNATGGCDTRGGPGAAMQDHPIFSATWNLPNDTAPWDGGEVIDMAFLKLTNGQDVSPLVWNPHFVSPLGEPLKGVGLRMVNRSDFYRCH